MTRSSAIEDWSTMRRMPPGRRAWCYHAAAAELDRLGATELAALAREAEGAEELLIALTLRFKTGQATTDPSIWPREVVTGDPVVDRRVSGVFDLLRTFAGLFAGTPDAKLWQDLLLATFPAGAAYYTNVPYIEEVARIRALLAELKHERWARLVGEGVLAAAIGELTATFEPYAAVVGRFVDQDRVSWDEVKDRDLANHRRLCLFIARLHVTYADDEATRATLLAPFARQDQEIYEIQRARRRVTDVDPQSGTPIDEAPPEAPPADPAAPPA